MDGFLNLNKPAGFTSHDCVAKVRRSLKLKRVGHAGTLDPAATGVLPIAIGRATRLLQFLPQDKAYRATIRLGVSTATDDLEGDVLFTQSVTDLDLDTVNLALQTFHGTIQQVPPNYSAIQVQGQRLYDLARSGQSVQVQARPVEIHHIQVLDWRPGAFPELEVEIVCGPGTYIRAIARDLGQALKTGGTLAQLLRTESSHFRLENSVTLEAFVEQAQEGTLELVPPEVAVQTLEAIALPTHLAKRWCQGQRIASTDLQDILINSNSPLRIHNQAGTFLGIGQRILTETDFLLTAKVVFEPD
jgi:tRNA pseudouridine55 synthase